MRRRLNLRERLKITGNPCMGSAAEHLAVQLTPVTTPHSATGPDDFQPSQGDHDSPAHGQDEPSAEPPNSSSPQCQQGSLQEKYSRAGDTSDASTTRRETGHAASVVPENDHKQPLASSEKPDPLHMHRPGDSQPGTSALASNLPPVKTNVSGRRPAIQVWASFAGPLPDFSSTTNEDSSAARASDR